MFGDSPEADDEDKLSRIQGKVVIKKADVLSQEQTRNESDTELELEPIPITASNESTGTVGAIPENTSAPPKLLKDEKVLKLGKLFHDSFLSSQNQLNFAFIQKLTNPTKLQTQTETDSAKESKVKRNSPESRPQAKVSPDKKSSQSRHHRHPSKDSSDSHQSKSKSSPAKPIKADLLPTRSTRHDPVTRRPSDHVPPDSTDKQSKKSEMANLIIKCLMPFYKDKTIASKDSFKIMARDMSHEAIQKGLNTGKLEFVTRRFNN